MAVNLPHPTISPIPDTEPDAVPSLWNDRYTQIDANFAATKAAVDAAANTVALHNHDGSYAAVGHVHDLSGYAVVGHTHTPAESGAAAAGHTHTAAEISGLPGAVDLSGYAVAGHNHNGTYSLEGHGHDASDIVGLSGGAENKVHRVSRYVSTLYSVDGINDVTALPGVSLYVDASLNLYFRDIEGYDVNGKSPIYPAKCSIPAVQYFLDHMSYVPNNTIFIVTTDKRLYYKDNEGVVFDMEAKPWMNLPHSHATTDITGLDMSNVAKLNATQEWTKAQYGDFIEGSKLNSNQYAFDFDSANNFRATIFNEGINAKEFLFSNPNAGQSGVIEIDNNMVQDLAITLTGVGGYGIHKTFSDQYIVSGYRKSLLTYVCMSGGNPIFSLVKDYNA